VKLSGAPVATASGVKLRLTCSAPAGQSCVVTDTLTSVETLSAGKPTAVAAGVRKRKRTVVVASRTFTIAAGQTATVTLTLNRAGRSLLARFRKLPLKLTVFLREGAHAATVATRTLTIKPRKHPGKHGGKPPSR
jgi:hypothetical protein